MNDSTIKVQPAPAVNDAPLPAWRLLQAKAGTFSFLAWLFLFGFVVGVVAVLMMSLTSWAIGSSFSLVQPGLLSDQTFPPDPLRPREEFSAD